MLTPRPPGLRKKNTIQVPVASTSTILEWPTDCSKDFFFIEFNRLRWMTRHYYHRKAFLRGRQHRCSAERVSTDAIRLVTSSSDNDIKWAVAFISFHLSEWWMIHFKWFNVDEPLSGILSGRSMRAGWNLIMNSINQYSSRLPGIASGGCNPLVHVQHWAAAADINWN